MRERERETEGERQRQRERQRARERETERETETERERERERESELTSEEVGVYVPGVVDERVFRSGQCLELRVEIDGRLTGQRGEE